MKRLAFAVLFPAVLVGCVPAELPDVLTARSPVDPAEGGRRSADPAVIGDFTPRLPTEPRNWRRLNDERSPAGGGAS